MCTGLAASSAPTATGAQFLPDPAVVPVIQNTDAPTVKFAVYRSSSGRHTVAIILSANVCRLAVHSGNR